MPPPFSSAAPGGEHFAVYRSSVLPSELALGYLGPGHDAELAEPTMSFQSPWIRRSLVTKSYERGDVVVAPLMRGHMSIESIGGSGGTCAAACASAGSTPARPQYVAHLPRGRERTKNSEQNKRIEQTKKRNEHAHQSLMCSTPWRVVPRTLAGRNPPLTNELARMPPSKSEYLPPRIG